MPFLSCIQDIVNCSWISPRHHQLCFPNCLRKAKSSSPSQCLVNVAPSSVQSPHSPLACQWHELVSGISVFLRKLAPSIKCTEMRPCLITVNNIPCKHCRRGRTFHELSPCKERLYVMVLSGTLEKCLLLVREKGRGARGRRRGKKEGERKSGRERKRRRRDSKGRRGCLSAYLYSSFSCRLIPNTPLQDSEISAIHTIRTTVHLHCNTPIPGLPATTN